MQSILQYRRFRRHLQEQVDRHGVERVAAFKSVLDKASGKGAADGQANGSAGSGLGRPSQDEKSVKNGSVGQCEGVGENAREEYEDVNLGLPDIANAIPNAANAAVQPDALDDLNEKDIERQADIIDDSHGASFGASSSSLPPHALETAATHETTRTAPGQTMTGMDVRTRQTNEGGHGKEKVFIVEFQGQNGPLNPHTWSMVKKVAATLLISQVGFIVGWASSIDSAALKPAMEKFGVSAMVESLATGTYLIGFGFGAFFAGPISETVGRNPVYLATLGLFMVFIMASGLAPNITAQLIFRLLAGFFGSTPLTCAGGSISDMWSPSERTVLFPVFANAAFLGPALGPIVGAFISESSVISWRWCEWVTLIWTGLILLFLVLFLPETYAPVLLKWKAHQLRTITGDDRYRSALEVQAVRFQDRLIINMYRPFVLFAYEPIVILFTLYLTVVYIVFFTFLTGELAPLLRCCTRHD